MLSENGFKAKLRKLFSNMHPEKNGAVELFFSNPFCGTLGIVMNRRLALSLQGFDKNWYPVADYEFWCRWACQIGPIPFVRKQIGLYRLQENESLRLDVRKGFVSGSTSIRQALIAQRNVPHWFVHMVGIVAWIQEKSINIDWRKKNEPDPIFFRLIVLRLWRKMVFFICYFCEK